MTVTVASVTKSVAVGETITITVKLNSKGRKALNAAKRHRLSVRLTVDQTSAGIARRLTSRKLVVRS